MTRSRQCLAENDIGRIEIASHHDHTEEIMIGDDFHVHPLQAIFANLQMLEIVPAQHRAEVNTDNLFIGDSFGNSSIGQIVIQSDENADIIALNLMIEVD